MESCQPVASVTLVDYLALTACTWMAPDFRRQTTRRYGMATLMQTAAVPVAIAAPRVGVAIALLCVVFFLLPQPKWV